MPAGLAAIRRGGLFGRDAACEAGGGDEAFGAAGPPPGEGTFTVCPHPEHFTLRPAMTAGAEKRLPHAGQANNRFGTPVGDNGLSFRASVVAGAGAGQRPMPCFAPWASAEHSVRPSMF